MLHQDEWSMSTTPREFHILNMLLRNLLVHGMTSLLIVHVPPFIHSCIICHLKSKPNTIRCFLISRQRLSSRGIPRHFLNTETHKKHQEQRPTLAIQARAPLTLHQSRLTLVVAPWL